MSLDIQIYLILYSFIYGFIFSILLDFNYKYLLNKSLLINIIISFMFSINSVLIYFIFLKKINNGILHMYSFVMIILGFLMSHFTLLFIDNKIKKCYNGKNKWVMKWVKKQKK